MFGNQTSVFENSQKSKNNSVLGDSDLAENVRAFSTPGIQVGPKIGSFLQPNQNDDNVGKTILSTREKSLRKSSLAFIKERLQLAQRS